MDRGRAVKVYLVAVFFAVTTGFSFLGAKTALIYGTPLESLFFRFVFGFAFALAVVMATGGIKLRGRPIRPLLIPACCYSIGFFGFQFVGLMYASSIEAGIIMAVQPAITMLIAEFAIKEKPSIAQRICVVVAIVAAGFISLYGSVGVEKINVLGVILISLSAISMAANVVYLRWIRKDYTPKEISFVSCALGFIFYSAAVIIVGLKNGNLGDTFGLLYEPKFVIAVAYLGVCCTMLTTLLNSYMMRYLEAVKVSVFGCGGTVITLMAGYFILNESITFMQIVSSVVILAAIVGTNALGQKGKNDGENQG